VAQRGLDRRRERDLTEAGLNEVAAMASDGMAQRGLDRRRERDLTEAGLNEVAAMASDGKNFKASGLRGSPGSNARTTWTLWHGCCYMGKVGFSPDVISKGYVRYEHHLRQPLRLEPDNNLPAADDKSAQLACGKSPYRPVDVGSRSCWSRTHQHRLSDYVGPCISNFQTGGSAPSMPWESRCARGFNAATAASFNPQNRICKEIVLQPPKTGKFDY